MMLMMLFTLLFWVLLLGGVALIVVWAINRTRTGPAESALDILDKRYARGEITREEYERMRREIREGLPSTRQGSRTRMVNI